MFQHTYGPKLTHRRNQILTLKHVDPHTHQQSGEESIFPIGQKMNGIARVQFETAT